MVFEKSRFKKFVLKSLSLIVLGATALATLLVGSAAAQGIVLDGNGSDWDPSWKIADDHPLDVLLTDTAGLHPHDAPYYARSGYDATSIWARYQIADGRWYFRIDVDGLPGDSDSRVGSAGNLGVGTHGADSGPLTNFTDDTGLGTSEIYALKFRFSSGIEMTSQFGPGTTILPGVIAATTGQVAGQGVYGATFDPGVIELAFDRAAVFPSGTSYSELWLMAHIGDASDRLSDDDVAATYTQIMALDLAANCPAAPLVVGEQAVFPLNYDIPAAAAFGASDVVLTADVPAGTTFVSASGGGALSGNTVTWNLGNLAPGVTGQQLLTLRADDPALTNVVLNTEMSCAEGLRYVSSDVCPLQAPTATPISTPTPVSGATPTPTPDEPSEVPEPATLSLLLSGLGALGGYAALRQRRRK